MEKHNVTIRQQAHWDRLIKHMLLKLVLSHIRLRPTTKILRTKFEG